MLKRWNLKRLQTFFVLISATAATAAGQGPSGWTDPIQRDSILDWNAIALQAVADDHSGTFGSPEQPGPTRSSRALAIVHLAMFDAANNVVARYTPYLVDMPGPAASLD